MLNSLEIDLRVKWICLLIWEYNGCTCASLLHLFPFNLIQFFSRFVSFRFVLRLFLRSFFSIIRFIHCIPLLFETCAKDFLFIRCGCFGLLWTEVIQMAIRSIGNPVKWMQYFLNYWITKSIRRILSSIPFEMRLKFEKHSLRFECQRRKQKKCAIRLKFIAWKAKNSLVLTLREEKRWLHFLNKKPSSLLGLSERPGFINLKGEDNGCTVIIKIANTFKSTIARCISNRWKTFSKWN